MIPSVKVLFLDIDGPIIPGRAWILQGGGLFDTPDPVAGAVIKRLCERGIKLVISSTWRKGADGILKCAELLQKCGIDADDVLYTDWRTQEIYHKGQSGNTRAEEIHEWLSRHPEVTHWAAIDDDYMEIENFIHVSNQDGLLMKHQLALFNMFGVDLR